MRVDTKDICATIAYLIGVRKHIVKECFDEECHDLLESLYQNQDATTIRYLCKLRTTLMLKFKKTDDEMRFNLKNINRLDWYDADNIKQLEKWGYEIIKVNYRSEKYALDFSKLIHDFTYSINSKSEVSSSILEYTNISLNISALILFTILK